VRALPVYGPVYVGAETSRMYVLLRPRETKVTDSRSPARAAASDAEASAEVWRGRFT